MSALTLRTLREDAADRAYHVCAKALLVVPLAAYAVVFALSRHEEREGVAEAKDGLRMPLRAGDALPEWKLSAHSGAAMGLLACCLFLKETVARMARGGKAYAALVGTHRWVGRAALALVAVMDGAGLLMGPHSALDHFEVFIVFFAAPFAVFGALLYATASPRWIEYHRLFANMMVKGCIGTPLARWGGAALQRLGWADGAGYYQGIFGVAALLGAWQLVEVAQFVRAQRSRGVHPGSSDAADPPGGGGVLKRD